MILLKTCQHCITGDVQVRVEIGSLAYVCVQCGHRREFPLALRPKCRRGRKPKALVEQGRFELQQEVA